MDYKEFKIKLIRAEVPRKAKVRNSWGYMTAISILGKNIGMI